MNKVLLAKGGRIGNVRRSRFKLHSGLSAARQAMQTLGPDREAINLSHCQRFELCPLVFCQDQLHYLTQPHLSILPDISLPEHDPTWACLLSERLMTVACVVLHVHLDIWTTARPQDPGKQARIKGLHTAADPVLKHATLYLPTLPGHKTHLHIEIIWLPLVYK